MTGLKPNRHSRHRSKHRSVAVEEPTMKNVARTRVVSNTASPIRTQSPLVQQSYPTRTVSSPYVSYRTTSPVSRNPEPVERYIRAAVAPYVDHATKYSTPVTPSKTTRRTIGFSKPQTKFTFDPTRTSPIASGSRTQERRYEATRAAPVAKVYEAPRKQKSRKQHHANAWPAREDTRDLDSVSFWGDEIAARNTMQNDTTDMVEYGDSYRYLPRKKVFVPREFDDWDQKPGPLYGQEIMPSNEVTFSDLFPCLGELFDFCGCDKKIKKRQIRAPPHNGPLMESVCLECGHVLESHSLPCTPQNNAFRDFDWSPMAAGATRGLGGHMGEYYNTGVVDGQDSKAYLFDGYRDWRVDATADRPQLDEDLPKRPLPLFPNGESRLFKNHPMASGGEVWAPPRFRNQADESGKIHLPAF